MLKPWNSLFRLFNGSTLCLALCSTYSFHIPIYPFICWEIHEWHPKYPVEVFKIIHAQQEWPRANESNGFYFRFNFFLFFFFISFRHFRFFLEFFVSFFHVVLLAEDEASSKKKKLRVKTIFCAKRCHLFAKKNIYIIQSICPLNCVYKCVKLS